jgi:hypothetical protein
MDLSVLSSEEDMALPAAVYRPRRPQDSDYYRCVEDYFETFIHIYDEHFSRQYGFWRPYVEQVIYRYLDCGDLHNSFARSNKCWLRAVILTTISNLKLRISRYYK